MRIRNNGSIIGPVNTPSGTSASGVWSLPEHFVNKVNGTWVADVAATNGSLTTSGGTQILTFTSNGQFTLVRPIDIEILVVA